MLLWKTSMTSKQSSKYDFQTVYSASEGAAAFYVWVGISCSHGTYGSLISNCCWSCWFCNFAQMNNRKKQSLTAKGPFFPKYERLNIIVSRGDVLRGTLRQKPSNVRH